MISIIATLSALTTLGIVLYYLYFMIKNRGEWLEDNIKTKRKNFSHTIIIMCFLTALLYLFDGGNNFSAGIWIFNAFIWIYTLYNVK
jgi:hypothetical protein